MKKIGIALLLAATVKVASAQGDVVSAFNANKDGKYEEAVTFIEKAASDPKATGKEKYWRYRGNIYMNVANDATLAAKYPNAIQIAKESYFKSMELDKAKDYYVDVQNSLGGLQSLTLQRAQDSYNAKDFCSAADNFTIAREISEKFSLVDSSAIFNSSFCYERCGKTDLAMAGYAKCGEIGYNVPDVYMYIAEIHQKAGNNELALKTLSDARAKYPKDASLLRSEVNIYLTAEQYDKAETLLKSLVEADPKNETIWFVLGVTYEKLNKRTEEEEAYKKAIELNGSYYDALFNLGAMYFNDGLEKEKICNEIPAREKAKYDDCVAANKVMFANAVQALESAYNLKSSEKEIIAALKDAYYKGGNMEGYNKMKALLQK
jgi:tetratricopeptide (TPR) repeat protein